MATRLRDHWINAAVAALVVGALVAIAADLPESWTGDSERPAANALSADGDARGMRATDESPDSTAQRLRIERTPAGDINLDIPPNAYLSEWDAEVDDFTEPSPVPRGTLRFNSTSHDAGQVGRKIVYETDSRERVVDVRIFSNSRSNGRLADMQWLMSKNGVELIWDDKDKNTWSIHRSQALLTKTGTGHYFDPAPVTKPSYYAITHEQRSRVERPDGGTTMATRPTTYVMYVPAFDKGWIGLPIEEVNAAEGVGYTQGASGSSPTGEVERTSFVQSNSLVVTVEVSPHIRRAKLLRRAATRYRGSPAGVGVHGNCALLRPTSTARSTKRGCSEQTGHRMPKWR